MKEIETATDRKHQKDNQNPNQFHTGSKLIKGTSSKSVRIYGFLCLKSFKILLFISDDILPISTNLTAYYCHYSDKSLAASYLPFINLCQYLT